MSMMIAPQAAADVVANVGANVGANVVAIVVCFAATGCAPQAGLTDVMQRPAERALFNGLRAYDDGQYAEAERALQDALKTGLVSAKDRANAHKHLAFVYCTSERAPACEAAFRAARIADPQFALSKAESGHPQWGPVYNKVASTR
jgi:Tfp pilus assembly protein PilF